MGNDMTAKYWLYTRRAKELHEKVSPLSKLAKAVCHPQHAQPPGMLWQCRLMWPSTDTGAAQMGQLRVRAPLLTVLPVLCGSG